MIGCFTRNIYVWKICLHYLCAFEIIPRQFRGKKRSWVSLPLVRRTGSLFPWCHQKNFLECDSVLLRIHSCKVRASVVLMLCHERCWLGFGGGKHLRYSSLISSLLLTQCLFNLLTSICTYKLRLQKNTLTGIDSQLSLLGMGWHTDCGIAQRYCFWSIVQ